MQRSETEFFFIGGQSECLPDRQPSPRYRMWVFHSASNFLKHQFNHHLFIFFNLRFFFFFQKKNLSAEIENLKQNLYLVIETMRHTGVGALPILPQPNSEGTPVPTEQQLLTDTTRSLQALYDKVQRSSDSATAVANLLSSDHVSRSGK